MAYETTFTKKCEECGGNGWYRDDYENHMESTYKDQGCLNCGGQGTLYYKDYRRKSVSYGELKKGSGRVKIKVRVLDGVCPTCAGKKKVEWSKDRPGLDYSKYNLRNPPPQVTWTEVCYACFGTGKECVVIGTEPDTGCFITTTVCEILGKPDDCYELRTLRNFRDFYVMDLPEGCTLWNQYKAMSAKINADIDNLSDKLSTAKAIHVEICEVIRLIEESKLEEALDRYRRMIKRLSG